PGTRVVALVTRNPANAAPVAEAAGNPQCAVYTDLADALKRPDVQLVIITTPSGAHMEPAVAAAEAKKHVVVEKPLEIALERIEVEDTAVACLRFANGALGVIQATTSVYPGLPKTVGIHGDRGTAVIEQDDVLRWDFNPETPEDRQVKERFAQKVGASG